MANQQSNVKSGMDHIPPNSTRSQAFFIVTSLNCDLYQIYRNLSTLSINPNIWPMRSGLFVFGLSVAKEPGKIHENSGLPAARGFYPEKESRKAAAYKNLRMSTASCSSKLMRRFAISFETSSAASYWFRYLFSDLTPILQPSVIRSAIV